MQQFLLIAAVHFLALLAPGPDFFLIARTSVRAGWRIASGACLGIALANGAFILMAFTGTAVLSPHSPGFTALQLAGSLYLLYLGLLFLRHAGNSTLHAYADNASCSIADGQLAAWGRAAAMGFLSGILNPKNALFYVSLAAMLSGPYSSGGWKVVYGSWMFSVVLLWDLLVAVLIGSPALLRYLEQSLPWLERVCAILLILLALGVISSVLRT